MDYQKQAQDFLDKHEITFSVVRDKIGCPLWCDGKHIHGDHHIVTFKRGTKEFKLDFWDSYKDKAIRDCEWNPSYRGKDLPEELWGLNLKEISFKKSEARKLPTAYDVLACLTTYDVGTIDDFISEFGYEMKTSGDFAKIQITYNAVVDEWRKVNSFFNDCLDELREIN